MTDKHQKPGIDVLVGSQMPDTFSKNRAAHDALGCCGRCRRAQAVAMVCYGDRKPLKSSTIRLGVAAGAGITAPTVSKQKKKSEGRYRE